MGNLYAAPEAELVEPIDVESQVLVLADRGTRFAGAILDNVFLMVVFFPLVFMAGVMAGVFNSQFLNNELAVNLVSFSLLFVVYLLLNGWLLKNSGQTLAKKILKIKIVDENGNVPTFSKLIIHRFGVFFLFALIPGGNLIGIVDALLIFREDRRCLHDVFAGTKVVKV